MMKIDISKTMLAGKGVLISEVAAKLNFTDQYHFSRIFSMELKPNQCYNAYVDIRRRKNDSRTYFFDRASEKLNERIVKDDERERARKR